MGSGELNSGPHLGSVTLSTHCNLSPRKALALKSQRGPLGILRFSLKPTNQQPTKLSQLGMLVPAFNPSTQRQGQRQEDLSKFETNQVYTVSSKTARAMQ